MLADLEQLVDDDLRGDPEQPLRWTAKSLRNLAAELCDQGHQISARSVAPLLRRLGYSLQANTKTREGASHPDRDAQFRHINATVAAALAAGAPAISVDTKKKELVGDFENAGRELHRTGQPEQVRTTTSATIPRAGQGCPLRPLRRRRRRRLGQRRDRQRHRPVRCRIDPRLVAAARLGRLPERQHADDHRRLWRLQRQPHPPLEDRAATARRRDRRRDPRLPLPGRHLEVEQDRAPPVQFHQPELAQQAARLPPGDHQPDRRPRPRTGLAVHVRLDEGGYPKGIKISNAQLAAVNLTGDPFHSEWNYTIKPRGQ